MRAFGGTDTVAVGDMSGIDLQQVRINLGAIAAAGDGAAGYGRRQRSTNGDDVIVVTGSGKHRRPSYRLFHAGDDRGFSTGDRLVINGLAGDDVVEGVGVNAVLLLTANGGNGERRARLGGPGGSTPSTATSATSCCHWGRRYSDDPNGGDGEDQHPHPVTLACVGSGSKLATGRLVPVWSRNPCAPSHAPCPGRRRRDLRRQRPRPLRRCPAVPGDGRGGLGGAWRRRRAARGVGAGGRPRGRARCCVGGDGAGASRARSAGDPRSRHCAGRAPARGLCVWTVVSVADGLALHGRCRWAGCSMALVGLLVQATFLRRGAALRAGW